MIDETEGLVTLGNKLRECEDRPQTLQVSVDCAASLLGVPRVSVWVLDPSRTALVAGARAGVPLHPKVDFEYRLGEGLLGWIAQKGLPIRLAEGEHDPRFLPRPGRSEPLRAFLGVPMLTASACIGVLSAVAPEVGYFSRHHEQLLTVIASLTSAHLSLHA